MDGRTSLALGAAIAVLLGGCSAAEDPLDSSVADGDPGFGHVHGLGLNPGDGLVYAATHFGVFRLDPSGPTRVADRYQDTMGFTVAGPDRFLGSGHPDMREDKPVHLGLVLSTDRAETWQTLSLEGQVDFHALATVGSTVYGWDATSGSVMRSDDAGATWFTGTELDVTDIAVDPDDPAHLFVAGSDGLSESANSGATFQPALTQPPQQLAYVRYLEPSDLPGLVGVDTRGSVWVYTGGAWKKQGSLPAPPEAFTVAGVQLLAATAGGVFTSVDTGTSWQLLEASITGE